MKTITYILLALAVLGAAAYQVSASSDVLICHKPDKPAEHWLWVNEHALPGHMGHGDQVWPDVTTCGGVDIPNEPPEVPVATEEPDPPVVTEEPEPPVIAPVWRLWLPLIETCFPWRWPCLYWDSGSLGSDPYPAPSTPVPEDTPVPGAPEHR